MTFARFIEVKLDKKHISLEVALKVLEDEKSRRAAEYEEVVEVINSIISKQEQPK